MNDTEKIPEHSAHHAWMCSECGYIYDPADGDLETNIKPGIPFVNLPGEWCCPVCNRERTQFKPFQSQL
ncbi:MAG: rubredoxin [Chlorobiaceae bacterium]|jgi:rubredoxin|nr:rubredoxin [Chlorobiaceae bacterium]